MNQGESGSVLVTETALSKTSKTAGRGSKIGKLLLTGVICVMVITVFWLHRGFGSAKAALQSRKYATARHAVERYLWLHPQDHEARMLAAQAYFLDDDLPAETSATQAIEHLQKIPDDASMAAEARMLAGRLIFLILLQPTRAEQLFLRSLELNPDQFDSNYLLWKLYDMTERYFSSEPFFRASYERVPDDQKAFRLREWYLSQFNPLSACGELDALMGFRQPSEPASELVNFRRLSEFAIREPNSPVVAAAIAQARLRNRERDQALQTLEQVPDMESIREPFYIATLTEVLLELGQLDRAKAVFARWPQPAAGYRYWRISGLVAQLADADFGRAAEQYDRALEIWPGPSDWLTMHRRFRCLALLGDKTSAEAARKRSRDVEDLMEIDVHQKQKEALTDLGNPDQLQELVQFYEDLNRPWEQQEWKAAIDRLKSEKPL